MALGAILSFMSDVAVDRVIQVNMFSKSFLSFKLDKTIFNWRDVINYFDDQKVFWNWFRCCLVLSSTKNGKPDTEESSGWSTTCPCRRWFAHLVLKIQRIYLSRKVQFIITEKNRRFSWNANLFSSFLIRVRTTASSCFGASIRPSAPDCRTTWTTLLAQHRLPCCPSSVD